MFRVMVSLLVGLVFASWLSAADVDRDAVVATIRKRFDEQTERVTALRSRVAANKLTAADESQLRDDLPNTKKPTFADKKAAQKKILARLDGQLAELKNGQWAGHQWELGTGGMTIGATRYASGPITVGDVGRFPAVRLVRIEGPKAICIRTAPDDPAVYVLKGFDCSQWVTGKAYRVEDIAVVSGVETFSNGTRAMLVEPLKAYWPETPNEPNKVASPQKK